MAATATHFESDASPALNVTTSALPTYTFIGPDSGNVNSTSTNFIITPDSLFTGTISIALSGAGASGLTTPIIKTFSNSSTAQTFTITPTVAGSITLTPTNSGSLINPSLLTYTANAVVPGAPTGLSPTPGNTQVSLTWTAPANTGGSAITDYLIEYKLSTEPTNWTTFSHSASIATNAIVTSLTNGSLYNFRVSAINSVGTSSPSSVVNSTPAAVAVPGAPTEATATAGNAQATIIFTAPASNGGSAITGYTVISSPAGGTDSNAGTTALSHVVTGLTNGTAYTFTVTATNAVGTGPASSASNGVTPLPSNIATITSEIYVVSAEGSSAEAITNVPSSTSRATFLGALVKGNINQSWGDTDNTISDPVVTGDILEVTAEDGVNFIAYTVILTSDSCPGTPFVSYGGKTYYTVQIGAQCWLQKNLNVGTKINSPTLPTNDSNIQKYCFNNEEANCDIYGGLYTLDELMNYSSTESSQGICPIGWRVPSNIDFVTLSTYLGGDEEAGSKLKERGIVHFKPTNTSATYSSGFTGLPSGYLRNDSVIVFAEKNTTGYFYTSSLSNLEGTWYPIFRSLNYGSVQFPHGQSFRSTAHSVRCLSNNVAPLGAPTGVSAVPGESQATVTFTAPASNGGSTIISYTVTSNPGSFTTTGASSPLIVTGLSNGTSYTFTVTATNANETGPASTASNIVTPSFAALAIGDSYQGGKVAYILQEGDPGYVAGGQVRGLIAAPSDQSTGAEWGCWGTTVGAAGTVIGTGNQNTTNILSGCSESGIAAKLAGDLVIGAYNDWYLPSKDELNKVLLNATAVGGFTSGGYYWSSSEYGQNGAQAQQNYNASSTLTAKTASYHVRPIRAFVAGP